MPRWQVREPGRHKRRIQPEPTRQVWRRDLTPRPADGLEDRVVVARSRGSALRPTRAI